MATCPNCGEIVMEGDPYCSNCGTTFSWDDDEESPPENPVNIRACKLKEEAWRLYQDGRDSKALEKINQAIELDGYPSSYYNVKAIILEGMFRYDEALKYYDISLNRSYSPVVKNNKARLLETIARGNIYSGIQQYALDCINDALRISTDEVDRKSFLKTKAEILERLGRIADSRICTYLAAEMYDKVDEIESQTKAIMESKDAIICIAGTQFYERKLERGDIVSLVREPENEHDPDAIRIEKDGETAGYVANSAYTLVDGAKSASEIKNLVKDNQKAQVMFMYLDNYLIARIIKR